MGIRCQRGEVSEVTRALGDYNLMVPSVIAMRQWGDFEGWEHQLVLDEAKRRFALGARLGTLYCCNPTIGKGRNGTFAGEIRRIASNWKRGGNPSHL